MSSTLAYYILAAVLGYLLSWLITGGSKKQVKLLEEQAKKERLAMNDLLTDFKLLQNDTKSQLQLRDKEISKLKKSKAFPDIIANAQEKEITHWKNKAKELETRINKQSNKTNGSSGSSHKATAQLKELKAKLNATKEELKAKESLLARMEDTTDKPSIKSANEVEHYRKKIAKLTKKIKAQKKKLKAKPKKEIETIEIKETLNIPKIAKLLKKGKLTKKSKKVLKRKKKAEKAVEQKKENLPASSSPKSIFDLIPELKSNS